MYATMPVADIRTLDLTGARLAVVALAKAVSTPGIGEEELTALRERLAAARAVLTPPAADDDAHLCRFTDVAEFEAKSLWFKKDVARVGDYTHPTTGRKFDLSLERAQAIARETNRYLNSINQPLPLPDGHRTGDARNNMGWVWSLEVVGDRLICIGEATSSEAKASLGTSMRAVSMSVSPEVKNERGEVFKDVVTHVAITSEPALGDQRNFETLDFGRGTVYVEAQEGEPAMLEITKEAAEAVNLSRTPSAEDVSEKLLDLSKSLDATQTERDGLRTEIDTFKQAQADAEAADWARFLDEQATAAAENKTVEAFGRQKDAIQKVYDAGCVEQAKDFARAIVGAPKAAPAEAKVAHKPDAVEAAKETAKFASMSYDGLGWTIEMDEDGCGFTRTKVVGGEKKSEKHRFEVSA